VFPLPFADFAYRFELQPTAKYDIMISNLLELRMAQFIVRNLEDDVKARLKRRAAQHRRSMEEEVRHILRDAVKEQNRHIPKLGSRIAARFAKAGLSMDLPELHGQISRSAEFGK
jgi:plasmid stability protein